MRTLNPAELSSLPGFLGLRGQLCVVVGGGRTAEPKIAALLVVGAVVRVVAPRANEAIHAWAEEGKICWRRRSFVDSDADGASLIIAAAAEAEANREVARIARARQIVCSGGDSSIQSGASRRAGRAMRVACPTLARRLRVKIEPGFGSWSAGILAAKSSRRRRFLL